MLEVAEGVQIEPVSLQPIGTQVQQQRMLAALGQGRLSEADGAVQVRRADGGGDLAQDVGGVLQGQVSQKKKAAAPVGAAARV